jgi:hypothetical protein
MAILGHLEIPARDLGVGGDLLPGLGAALEWFVRSDHGAGGPFDLVHRGVRPEALTTSRPDRPQGTTI